MCRQQQRCGGLSTLREVQGGSTTPLLPLGSGSSPSVRSFSPPLNSTSSNTSSFRWLLHWGQLQRREADWCLCAQHLKLPLDRGTGTLLIIRPSQQCPLSLLKHFCSNCTVSKRVIILRTWSLIKTFLAFWVLNGSFFIFQGPYFHFFGFIHAKNVNSVCMYTTMVLV